MRYKYDGVLEGDITVCTHDRAALVLGDVPIVECEGSRLTIVCAVCGEDLVEEVMYE